MFLCSLVLGRLLKVCWGLNVLSSFLLQAPSKVKISDVSFKNIRGTSATPVVVQIACSSGIPCEKVQLADIKLAYSGPGGPAKSQCSNVKPIISGIMSAPGC